LRFERLDPAEPPTPAPSPRGGGEQKRRARTSQKDRFRLLVCAIKPAWQSLSAPLPLVGRGEGWGEPLAPAFMKGRSDPASMHSLSPNRSAPQSPPPPPPPHEGEGSRSAEPGFPATSNSEYWCLRLWRHGKASPPPSPSWGGVRGGGSHTLRHSWRYAARQPRNTFDHRTPPLCPAPHPQPLPTRGRGAEAPSPDLPRNRNQSSAFGNFNPMAQPLSAPIHGGRGAKPKEGLA
jgi:hypothetical protein